MFYRHESFPSSSSQSFFFNAPAPDQYTLQTFRGYSPYYAATGQNGFNPPIYDPFENRLVYPTNTVADRERQVCSVENYRPTGPVDSYRGSVDSGREQVDSTTFHDSEDRWEINRGTGRPIKIGGRVHKRLVKRKNRDFETGSPSGTSDHEKNSSQENSSTTRSSRTMDEETSTDGCSGQSRKKPNHQTDQNALVYKY